MHYLDLQDVRPGMKTAAEIYGADGHLFMPLNIEISEAKLDILKSVNTKAIYVIENVEDTEYIRGEEPGLEKNDKIKLSKNLKAIFDEEQTDITSFFYTRCFVNFNEDVDTLIKQAAKGNSIINRYSIRTEQDSICMHLYATGLMCAMLATRLGLSAGEVRAAAEAGLLHDIGKKFYPDGDKNYEHTRAACEFLMEKGFSRRTMHGIRDHHEFLDGSGGPDGKSGDRIRTAARIVAICNTFDHYVNVRKAFMRPSIALRKMKASGRYDKEMLETFSEMISPYFLGESVMLSDFSGGYIIGVNPADPEDPVYINVQGKRCKLSETGLSIASYDGLKVQKMILIADDDPVILRTTKELLAEDYKVVCVTTGKAALDFVKTVKIPDLILMDFKMPKMDGAFAAELIQDERRGKDIPIVFMTGATDSESVQQCISLHPAGYLVKPVKKETLLETVNGILK